MGIEGRNLNVKNIFYVPIFYFVCSVVAVCNIH